MSNINPLKEFANNAQKTIDSSRLLLRMIESGKTPEELVKELKDFIAYNIKDQAAKAGSPFICYVVYSVIGLLFHKTNMLIILLGSLLSIFVLFTYIYFYLVPLIGHKFNNLKLFMFYFFRNLTEIFSYGISTH